MLSKAEILYLQGQKQVSKSYERKLKCLNRKKMEVLQEELPLLSKLLRNEANSVADISNIPESAAPIAKNVSSFVQPNQPLRLNNHATEFSNAESNGIEIDAGKDIRSQNSEGFTHLVMDNSTPATEFNNVQNNGATKNSNPHEIHDRELNPTNISLSHAFEQKNFNISNQTNILSYMGRVGFEPTTPAMSRRYLNQARPPALVL